MHVTMAMDGGEFSDVTGTLDDTHRGNEDNLGDSRSAVACPEFSLLWRDLESYLSKRLCESCDAVAFLAKILRRLQSTGLRMEELAYLIGCAFSNSPDIVLCLSLFLPDSAVIYVGKPAAAMCSLIHNIAPDKYVIFNSILKSCMAQKGTKEILLHKMQLLFRGNPLVIRAIRKLLVQQFCMEKNVGAILQNQPVEIIKPFDEEPIQVHSLYNFACHIGSNAYPERGEIFASEVLFIVRLFLEGKIHFSTLSDELDRLWSAYALVPSMLESMKQQVFSISNRDIQRALLYTPILKISAGLTSYSKNNKTPVLLAICDLFVHHIENCSLTLRLEVSNILSKIKKGTISVGQGLRRIADLLSHLPHSSEMFGCLSRVFHVLHSRKRPYSLVSGEEGMKTFEDEYTSEHKSVQKKLNAFSDSSKRCILANKVDVSRAISSDPDISEEALAYAAETVSQYVMPARLKTQQALIQLIGTAGIQPVYTLIDEWNTGLLSKEQVVASLTGISGKDTRARHAVRSLVTLLDNKRGGRQRRLTGSLSRQLYDSWIKQGSYRRLPGEWPVLECNGRDSLCWEVLNDRWASFPDNSESQPRNTNRHEEMLLRLEDMRYDWDLRILRLESCIAKLNTISKLLKSVLPSKRPDVCIRLSYFSQVDVECFRKIFGSSVEQVISYLCASPLSSLNMIYNTLAFKLRQWVATRELLDFAWTEQESPHWSGSIDFKRRFGGDKRGGE